MMKMILYFFNKLKNGDINDIKYKRTLINIFVKSVYLYEEKVTIIFNIDNISVTVDSIILDKIDKKSKNCILLLLAYQKGAVKKQPK